MLDEEISPEREAFYRAICEASWTAEDAFKAFGHLGKKKKFMTPARIENPLKFIKEKCPSTYNMEGRTAVEIYHPDYKRAKMYATYGQGRMLQELAREVYARIYGEKNDIQS